MSVNRLDNEFGAFIEAQETYQDEGLHTLSVTSAVPLKKYTEESRVQSRLDRVSEQRLTPAQLEYLKLTERFEDGYLKWLKELRVPFTKVLVKDEHLKVVATGTMAELTLWRVPISIQLHELYFSGMAMVNELDSTIVEEGLHRFQTKMDLLRGSGASIVEAGSAQRYHYDWYTLLIPLMMGELGDHLLGTTNVHTAMLYGLKPLYHPTKVKSPSVREMEGLALIAEQPDTSPLVVSGVDAFQTAHLYSHFGNDLLFEWGADLTADVGAGGGTLPLSFTTI